MSVLMNINQGQEDFRDRIVKAQEMLPNVTN